MGASVKLVEENSFCASDSGFEFKVRLNWYRSLPLSCIENLTVQLDGQTVDPKQIRLLVNECEHNLDELADIVDEYWFVQDSAKVRVKLPSRVRAGEEHTINVEIILRAPYIKIGPDRFLTMSSRYSSIQTAV